MAEFLDWPAGAGRVLPEVHSEPVLDLAVLPRDLGEGDAADCRVVEGLLLAAAGKEPQR